EVPEKKKEKVDDEDVNLGSWLAQVRSGHRPVGDATRAELDRMGMRWEKILNTDTQLKLKAAKQFYEREGHLEVRSDWKEKVDDEDVNLGYWITSVRSEHTKVDDATRAELDRMGMRWEKIRDTDTQLKLKAAKQFYERERNLEVPQDHKEPVDGENVFLGSWILNVRSKHTKVDDATRAELDRMGMRWEKIRDIDARLKLKAAKQFYEREGHLEVRYDWKEKVDDEDVNLGHWISNVRLKHAEVDDATRAELDRMGMRWEKIRDTDTQLKLKAAKQWYEAHGDLEVPRDHKEPVGREDVNLGNWIKNVRSKH
ncbi:helicase associated domain-containing protein, partial [Actinacidiphila sp. bgisy167]|uniref:helicase associated domain-containing protein n=1 Tax=Actinacidiphila sp. bgisy167 TaxID=3413797 RepID=UPI003D7223DE